jgi:APA family basic amino acid/polyamine antiporter
LIDEQETQPQIEAPKRISGITATNIVVANMIGTGVFTSLGFQVAAIQSDFSLISLWVIGGLAALCGALCYAELAAALPRSGGEYHFLSRIFHPALGFMAGWVSATVGFAAPIALAAMAFGTYFQAFGTGLSPVLLSLILVWLVNGVQLGGIRAGEIFQNLWTVVKVLLILALVIAGLMVAHPQPLQLAPGPGDLKSLFSGPFAVSLVYVMYSYSGWNAATYITEEVRNPSRNVPWSLLLGTAIVTVFYVALNYVFLLSTPKSALAGQLQVGLIAGKSIFGPLGGQIVSALISLGLIASVSAMTWLGPRVTKRMAEDLPSLRFFGRVSAKGTPYIAMLFQLIVVMVLLLTASFETVLIYIQFSLLLCSFLTVLGVIVLRIREPGLERPYRVWGYPVTPVIFLLITLHMMSYVIKEKPAESLFGLATVVAGLIVYFFSRRGSNALT